MEKTLETELVAHGIQTIPRDGLTTKQLQYVERKLSQGMLLDTIDNSIERSFTPFIALGLSSTVVGIAFFNTNPVSLTFNIAAGVFYMIALFLLAFTIYDLAFPRRSAQREYTQLVIFSALGILASLICAYVWPAYVDTVWYVASGGIALLFIYIFALWIRVTRFDVKHLLTSSSSGGYENLTIPPEEIQKQIDMIRGSIPNVRIELFKIESWIGNIGLPIHITHECNLYFYLISRSKGLMENEVVYLDCFWEE